MNWRIRNALLVSAAISFACTPGITGPVGGPLTDGVDVYALRVFVTSTSSFSGNLGGIVGADASCMALARSAGLERKYISILSDSTVSAIDRIPSGRKVYAVSEETGSILIVDESERLFSGSSTTLMSAIAYTEFGTDLSAASGIGVLTGTSDQGDAIPSAGQDFCDNWTSVAGGEQAYTGDLRETDSKWIHRQLSPCSLSNKRLYCISSD